MKSPLKLIFISLLFLTTTVCLKAQEKYDYAIVKYSLSHIGLYVSVSGKDFQKIEVKKDELKDLGNDFSPLLNYVQKMTNDGWRVINTINETISISFILEKKRN